MKDNIYFQNLDSELIETTHTFLELTQKYSYSKNMTWMGVQTMQYPEDLFALQEILWSTKPEVIIATGVASGGTLLFISSIMHSYIEHPLIIGIDPFVSTQTKHTFAEHVYGDGIHIVEMSSTDPKALEHVKIILSLNPKNSIMVFLDSMHETEHVFQELVLWSDLVTTKCYLIVGWTIIAECDDKLYCDRSWGLKSNPLLAVQMFLSNTDEFYVDYSIERKYLITTTGKGYLRKI